MGNDNTLLTIAVIVLIVSVVSFFVAYGTNMNIQFAPSGEGNVTVDIKQELNILFTTSLINWSSGSVDPASPGNNATLNSEGFIVGNLSFVNVTQGFVLENIGNVNANLSIKTDKTAGQFIGGGAQTPIVSPQYQYKVRTCETPTSLCAYGARVGNVNDTAQSCTGGAIALGSYVNVNTNNPGDYVCRYFNHTAAADELRIDVQIVIPHDAPTGVKSSMFTATAIAST